MKVWAYQTLGNILYALNRRDHLEKNNRWNRLTLWAWGKAWYLAEKKAGRIPEEVPG